MPYTWRPTCGFRASLVSFGPRGFPEFRFFFSVFFRTVDCFRAQFLRSLSSRRRFPAARRLHIRETTDAEAGREHADGTGLPEPATAARRSETGQRCTLPGQRRKFVFCATGWHSIFCRGRYSWEKGDDGTYIHQAKDCTRTTYRGHPGSGRHGDNSTNKRGLSFRLAGVKGYFFSDGFPA